MTLTRVARGKFPKPTLVVIVLSSSSVLPEITGRVATVYAYFTRGDICKRRERVG